MDPNHAQALGYEAANYDFTLRHALEQYDSGFPKKKQPPSRINSVTSITQPSHSNGQYLWNEATSPKSMKQNFSNSSLRDTHVQPTKLIEHLNGASENSMKRVSNALINSSSQHSGPTADDNDVYNDEQAKQIVGLFAYRFPSFREKLKQQFPDQWVTLFDNAKNGNKLHRSSSGSKHNLSAIEQTAQLFQFSQLKRNQRERLIHQVTHPDN